MKQVPSYFISLHGRCLGKRVIQNRDAKRKGKGKLLLVVVGHLLSGEAGGIELRAKGILAVFLQF